MRLVADVTNLVSGALWTGPSRYIIDAARAGRAELLSTSYLVETPRRVLHEDKFAAKLRDTGYSADAVADEIRELCTLVEAIDIPAPTNLRDPDDLAVLACGFAAGAAMIVTGDKDLLTLGQFRNIPIVRAVDAARALGYNG